MNNTTYLVTLLDETKQENQYLRTLLEYFYLSAVRGTNIDEFTNLLYGTINKDTYKRLIKEIDLLYVK